MPELSADHACLRFIEYGCEPDVRKRLYRESFFLPLIMRTVGQSFALLTRLCFDGGTASSNGCRRIETNCRRERFFGLAKGRGRRSSSEFWIAARAWRGVLRRRSSQVLEGGQVAKMA